MDFLFAIPSFIFHLISSLFSGIFSFIFGIIGIFLSPFKLAWGLLMGVGKTLISIVLLPTLLFSHPGDISAAQPVVGTTSASSSNNLEQIYNDINGLERVGRNMEHLRTEEKFGQQCGDKMREYQGQVKDLVEITNALPKSYKVALLQEAAGNLNFCVSCLSSAQDSCKQVRMGLREYQSNDE